MRSKYTYTRLCGVCLRFFHPLPKEVRKGKGKHCSRACFEEWYRKERAKKAADYANRFWSFVQKTDNPDECWIWTGACAGRTKNYGVFLRLGRQDRASHVAYELCVAPLKPAELVLHSCDNPRCVNPKHLFPGTHKDNTQDMIAKGRSNLEARRSYGGAGNPRAKLTPQQVVAIKETFQRGGISKAELARQYEVNASTIGRVVRGNTWTPAQETTTIERV